MTEQAGQVEIGVRLLHPDARLPWRAHAGDAGWDLHAVEAVIIPPGERRDIGTGIAVSIPQGHAGLVLPRSGLAFRRGIMVANAPGLIDAGYRGEIRVCLYNSGMEPFAVEPGDRVAQLVIQEVAESTFVVVGALDETARRDKGLGSTGERVEGLGEGP